MQHTTGFYHRITKFYSNINGVIKMRHLLAKMPKAATDRVHIGVVVDNSKLYVCARPSTVVGPPRSCTTIGQ
jgi:hypothetical protein